MKRIREYWAGKSVKQRIYLCIAFVMFAVLLFFIIKGNFFDNHITENPQQTETSQSQASDSGDSEQDSEIAEEIHLHISWIDVGILAGLFTAYGIHKYREKKREKRL